MSLWRGRLTVLLFSLVAIAGINLYYPPQKPLSPRSDSWAPGRTACQLIEILDGDTVLARCGDRRTRIRLIGIDAPEMGQRPWGARAKQALLLLLPQRFLFETVGKDIYGRRLGTLWVKNRDVGLEMIRRGQAVAYRDETTPPAYYVAQTRARAAARGIWAQPGAQRNPKRWRRYHR